MGTCYSLRRRWGQKYGSIYDPNFTTKGKYDGDRNEKGERHGRGKFNFDNGDVFDGRWKFDKMDGLGIYQVYDGETFHCRFEKGKLIKKPQYLTEAVVVKVREQLPAQSAMRSHQGYYHDSNEGVPLLSRNGMPSSHIHKKSIKKIRKTAIAVDKTPKEKEALRKKANEIKRKYPKLVD